MLSSVYLLFYFFFFSSRRRHTRCSRDWSSDVCSSDLGPIWRQDLRAHRNAARHDSGRSDRVDPEPWRQGGGLGVEADRLRRRRRRRGGQARKGAQARRRGARRSGSTKNVRGVQAWRKVTKAVFPVAGMGSRFLPATKASPKEMLPFADNPLIQYAVEEAVAAGIRDMVFITGRNKRAIEDHFDKAYEVESELAARGKSELLELIRKIIPKSVNCIYIRQPEPLGLGHAVLCAQPAVNDQGFAVILADDLIDGTPPALRQMTEIFERHQSPVVAVQQIPPEQSLQYGIVKTEPVTMGLDRVLRIVEKPSPEAAPSNLAVVGRYILTPRIFHHLAQAMPGAGSEIQLTDAIGALLAEDRVLAYRFKGTRYDCGSKLGYLQATVADGRKHPEVGNAFEKFLRSL